MQQTQCTLAALAGNSQHFSFGSSSSKITLAVQVKWEPHMCPKSESCYYNFSGSWWNPGEPWCPGGTLVEPHLKLVRTTPLPLQNLVEPTTLTTRNSGETKALLPQPQTDGCEHPETRWKSARTFAEPWCKPGVEPYFKPGGTLVKRPGPPRSLSGLRPQSFQLLGKKLSMA